MKEVIQAPTVRMYGIEGVRADDAWYFWSETAEANTEHAAILVAGEWWVVEIHRFSPNDTPISGPFESKEAALTALRIIDAAEGAA